MPLYTFRCSACSHEFEELVSFEKRDDQRSCKLCGKESDRKAAEVFGIKTTLDPKRDTILSNKEIDKVVGRESEKKWAGYNERWKKTYSDKQKARWKGREPQPVNMPKDPDGKYSPIMHIGDNKQKSIKREYVTALKEHRAEREKKGIKQFDAPGTIE